MNCAHCGGDLVISGKVKKLHPECRRDYRKDRGRERALAWRHNNLERARHNSREHSRRRPGYQRERLTRQRILAVAMEALLQEAGVSLEAFMEARSATSAIS